MIHRALYHPITWIVAVIWALTGLATASPVARQVIRAVWPT
jgi:hypothetical protein